MMRGPPVIVRWSRTCAAEHGELVVGHTFGTLVDGGPFESVFVRLALFRGGRGVAGELFEIEDLDVARARFEELRLVPRVTTKP